MKKLLVLLLVNFMLIDANAQSLKLRSVNLRMSDLTASTNVRKDKDGNDCAVIKIGIVGIDDLKFPEAIGEVSYYRNEYIVYIPAGTKSLSYESSIRGIKGIIDFDEAGLEIDKKCTYSAILDSDSKLRSAIFSVQPNNASIYFDGAKVILDETGMVMIDKPVGTYSYSISAAGYEPINGEVELVEDSISVFTNVELEAIMHPVNIKITPADANLFIDNIPYSAEQREGLLLQEGQHRVRVTADGYEDKDQNINVKAVMNPIDIALKATRTDVVVHSKERSRTRNSVRNAGYFSAGFTMLSVKDIGSLFSNKNAYDFHLDLSGEQHPYAIFSIREGLGFGIIKSNKHENYIEYAYDSDVDSLKLLAYIEVPLQVGISIPFGAFNQHLFSVYGGGYVRCIWSTNWNEMQYTPSEDSPLLQASSSATNDNTKKLLWDYGMRISASIDFGHLSIGADMSQSFNGYGFSYGARIGYKFY